MATGIGNEILWVSPTNNGADAGTSTISDLVGSNDGSLTNMDSATDWPVDTDNGGSLALDFDGSNDYVDFGDLSIVEGLPQFSVAMWVKANSPALSYRYLMGKIPSSGTGNRLGVFVNARRVGVAVEAGSFAFCQTNAILPTTPAWRHIGFSFDGTQSTNATKLKIYVSGSQETIAASTGTLGTQSPNNDGDLLLGHYNGAGSFAISARIDDFRVFDVILEAADWANLASVRGYEPAATGRSRPRINGGLVDNGLVAA